MDGLSDDLLQLLDVDIDTFGLISPTSTSEDSLSDIDDSFSTQRLQLFQLRQGELFADIDDLSFPSFNTSSSPQLCSLHIQQSSCFPEDLAEYDYDCAPDVIEQITINPYRILPIDLPSFSSPPLIVYEENVSNEDTFVSQEKEEEEQVEIMQGRSIFSFFTSIKSLFIKNNEDQNPETILDQSNVEILPEIFTISDNFHLKISAELEKYDVDCFTYHDEFQSFLTGYDISDPIIDPITSSFDLFSDSIKFNQINISSRQKPQKRVSRKFVLEPFTINHDSMSTSSNQSSFTHESIHVIPFNQRMLLTDQSNHVDSAFPLSLSFSTDFSEVQKDDGKFEVKICLIDIIDAVPITNYKNFYKKFGLVLDTFRVAPKFELNYSLGNFTTVDFSTRDCLIDCALNLSMNRFTNHFFNQLSHHPIRFLNLSYNKITDFDLFPCILSSTLQILDLSHNQISTLNFASKFLNLKYLDVSHNNLIENSNFELPCRLEYLKISHCRLSKLSCIGTNHFLKFLDLSFNPISSLHSLTSFASLHTLNLSNTNLTAFPLLPLSLFSLKIRSSLLLSLSLSLPNLQYLDASHNKIETVEGFNCPQILNLNISFNNLNQIQVDNLLKKDLRFLSKFFINDNDSQLSIDLNIFIQNFKNLVEFNNEEIQRNSQEIFIANENQTISSLIKFSKNPNFGQYYSQQTNAFRIFLAFRCFKFRLFRQKGAQKSTFLTWKSTFLNKNQSKSATIISAAIRGFLLRQRLKKINLVELDSDWSDLSDISDLSTHDFDLFPDFYTPINLPTPPLPTPFTSCFSPRPAPCLFKHEREEEDVEEEEEESVYVESISSSRSAQSSLETSPKLSDKLKKRQERFKNVQKRAQMNTVLQNPLKRLQLFQKRANLPQSKDITSSNQSNLIEGQNESIKRNWSSTVLPGLEKSKQINRVKNSAPAYLGGVKGGTPRVSRDRVQLPSITLNQAHIDFPENSVKNFKNRKKIN
ncbi:hypothetical protein RCL1_000790 [Eukaryota sp. TZLM3-RCL]